MHVSEAAQGAQTSRSTQMAAAYRFNTDRGHGAVREMILADIRRFSELGATGYVRDLTDALFDFDDACSMAGYFPPCYRRLDATPA